MTREEVIAVIKRGIEERGVVPSQEWFVKSGWLTRRTVRDTFGTFGLALEACGLERPKQGRRAELRDLFLDWATVVRKLGKVPCVLEYELHARYSIKPLKKRFGGWPKVPDGLMQFAREVGLADEWQDVAEIVARFVEVEEHNTWNSTWRTSKALKTRILKDRPVYGPPMVEAELLLEPTCESAVIFLFGAVAKKMGFAVLRIQGGYPDGEAFREMEPGKWQRVKIEFEYESRNFPIHGHAAEKCDLIVCWKHNWEECPLDVIELKSLIKSIASDQIVCAKCGGQETLTTDKDG